jgi:hypothetical protein
VKQESLKRRLDVKSDRLVAEYLTKRWIEDERRTEVLYKLYRGTDNIQTRPATHSEKVRLHKFVNEEKSFPYLPVTRMRDLLNCLALAIYTQTNHCPPAFDRQEWELNLLRATAQVGQKAAPCNDFAAIVSAIIPRRREKNRRKLRCKCCHTPILFGYILDGRKITRGKEFCSDACRAKSFRKRKRILANTP